SLRARTSCCRRRRAARRRRDAPLPRRDAARSRVVTGLLSLAELPQRPGDDGRVRRPTQCRRRGAVRARAAAARRRPRRMPARVRASLRDGATVAPLGAAGAVGLLACAAFVGVALTPENAVMDLHVAFTLWAWRIVP